MPPKRKNKSHVIDEPLEQLDNMTLLRHRQPNMPVGGLISPLDFQIAYPERLQNRVVFTMIIGLVLGILFLLLLQNGFVLLALPVICLAMPFVPIYPIFLKAGAYYVRVDLQYQIYGCIAGGRIRLIRAVDCILFFRNGAIPFRVDFSDMHRISTVDRIQIDLVGAGQFFYRPSLINLSHLSLEERQFLWNNILRESTDDILKSFLYSVRDAIQTHLSKLQDDNLWAATVVDLKSFVQNFLDKNRTTLGFSPGEFTINGEYPNMLVVAHNKKLSAHDLAEAQHANVFVLFEKLGISPTEENVLRYLLISRSNNRLRGDVNKLVTSGQSQLINTGKNIVISPPPTPALPTTEPLLLGTGDKNKASTNEAVLSPVSVDEPNEKKRRFPWTRRKQNQSNHELIETQHTDNQHHNEPPVLKGDVRKPPAGPF